MKTLLILGTILLSVSAFAGNEKGNGGGVHFCSQDAQIELYDIYEAQARFGYEIKNDKSTVDAQIANAIAKIKNTNPFIARVVGEQINYLKNGHTIIRDRVKLTPIGDAKILLVDEGCSYQQLANWDEVSGNLIVKKEFFDKMNNLNKAAFYIHETLYKVGRDFDLLTKNADGSTNSDEVRRMVGEIFSQEKTLSVLWTYNLDKIQEEARKKQEERDAKAKKRKDELEAMYNPIVFEYEQYLKVFKDLESSGINKCSADYFMAIRNVENSLIIYKNSYYSLATDYSLSSIEREHFSTFYYGASSQLKTFQQMHYSQIDQCKK